MRRIVKCENKLCVWEGVEREVRPLLEENGLLAWPVVICVCGFEPRPLGQHPAPDRSWVAWDRVDADIRADVQAAMQLVEDNPR